MNLYQLFVERALQLVRPEGRIGFILPSGLLSDAGTAPLRQHLFDRAEVDDVTGFDNRQAIFPVHRSVRFVLLSELLRTSDIVSLHVPLTDATRGMIGARELGLMKPHAVLVNTCRGPVVDEPALYQALKERRLGGAGLDVLVDEPPARDHPLFSLPNVTLTPHSAGPTWENWTSRFRNGFDNIERVAAGRKPLWVIPELLT